MSNDYYGKGLLVCVENVKRKNIQTLATAIVDGLLASAYSSKEPAPSFFCAFEKLVDVLETAQSPETDVTIIEQLLTALDNAKLKALPED